MDNYEAELEKFINWFVELDHVPAETRIDFLNHVISVGYMDEKAEKFVQDSLDHLVDSSQREADKLKRRYEVLKGAIEGQQDPKLSLVEHVLSDAQQKMEQLSDGLKTEFVTFESEKSQQEETSEKEGEEVEIERVRKGL